MWKVVRARNKSYGFNLLKEAKTNNYLLHVDNIICWWRYKQDAINRATELNNRIKNNNKEIKIISLRPQRAKYGGWGTSAKEYEEFIVGMYELRKEIKTLQERYDKAIKQKKMRTAHILLSLLNDKKEYLKYILRINREDYKVNMEDIIC